MSHWYDTDGSPMYTIVGANGKSRDTTLRDAKKFNLLPSVTTILQVPAKPALIRWLQDQILEAVINSTSKIPTDNNKIRQWKGMILEESQRITKEAAKRGTELHSAIEEYFTKEKETVIKSKEIEFLLPVLDLLNVTFGFINWKSEERFGHGLGFAGTVDLHSSNIVLDFKTKGDTANFDKDLGYDEHLMQLAAYRIGLRMPKAKCYNLFISTKTPGLLQLKEWSEEEIRRGEKMFLCLLDYWKLQNNYDPTRV